jgi:hypothetical protein
LWRTSTRVSWYERNGESGWTGRLIPLTMDGLIYASSMVMLDWGLLASGDDLVVEVAVGGSAYSRNRSLF